MSSNVTGEKKRRSSTSSSSFNNNNTNLASLNTTTSTTNTNGHSLLSHLDFSSQINAPMNTSPLLLVAAMASAWQNSNPAIFQRLQQHIRFQQQEQAITQKEEKSRLESKKAKQSKKLDEDEKVDKNSLSTTTSPRSHSNNSWLPALSPTHHQSSHKVRKLKLYSADEKIDIIDYAKMIGNRAAGREFNVAESSIREWRKNEERLRKQSETASTGNQRVEINYTDLIAKLDDKLVEYVEASADANWYSIRDRAQDLWPQVIKGSELDGSADSEMQITMGWVTRFMKRNENRVRRISPPVIATANAANNHNSSVSMVRKEPSFASTTDISSEKATVVSSHTNSTNPSPTSSPSPAITNSRRKCAQPRRAANATLLLTSESDKLPMNNKDEDSPAEKRPRTENEEKSEKLEEQMKDSDSGIKVC